MTLRPSRQLAAIAAAAALALAVTGCTSHHPHHVSASASAAARADTQRGEQIVATCLKRNTTVKSIYRCVVPKGSSLGFRRCVLQAVAAHDPATAAGRHNLEYSALPACVEDHR